jgi:molecular chaperone DnaK
MGGMGGDAGSCSGDDEEYVDADFEDVDEDES